MVVKVLSLHWSCSSVTPVGRERAPPYSWERAGRDKSRLPTWSPLTLLGQVSSPPCEMKPASLTPSQPRGRGTSWRPGGVETKDPRLAFVGVSQVQPAFSMMFGWKKANYCLKAFCLARLWLPVFWSFSWRNQAFLGTLLSIPDSICTASCFRSKSDLFEAKRNLRELGTLLFLVCQGLWPISLFPSPF